jgi:hypothetical protein
MKSWLFLPLLVSFSVQCLASNITIITSRVPNGTVDTAYSAAIKADNGCTPYKWTIVSGTLPTGIIARVSRNTTSFNLTGIPTKAVTDSFVVKATGCGGGVSQASYKIVIQSTANHIVNLDWNASTSTDVVGYNVYRSPDAATWKKINISLIGSTLYSDSTVANSSTYYYAATAVDIEGHESGKTSPVKVVVP